MSFSGDIKTIRVADAETPTDSVPARIRAVSVFSNGQGPTRFTITDNGVTVFDVDVVSGGYEYFDLPDLGIPCRNDLTISTADNLAEATIFYTGEVDLTAYTGESESESESESEGSLTAAIHLALETGTLTPVTGSVTPTFTRATERVMPDYQGILRTVPSGAFTPGGFRIVHNLVPNNSEDITAESVAYNSFGVVTATTIELTGTGNSYYYMDLGTGVADHTYVVRVKVQWISGATNVGVRVSRTNNAADYVVVDLSSGNEVVVALKMTPTATGRIEFGIDNRSSILWGVDTSPTKVTFTEFQLEDVTGHPIQTVSEYVSVGQLSTPYHGTGADGVRYFTTHNANTVSSNIVTAGTGAAITADNSKFGYTSGGAAERLEYTPSSMPTGSAIFIYEGAVDWTAGGNNALLGQVSATSIGSQSFIMYVNGRRLQAYVYDGSNVRSTSLTTGTLPFVEGEFGRVAAFLDVPNDEIVWKYSLDPPGTSPADATWVDLETEALSGSLSGLDAGTNPIVFHCQDAGNSGYANEVEGRVYAGYIIDGLDVTATPAETITPDDMTPQANAYIYTPEGLGYIPYPAVENLCNDSEEFGNFNLGSNTSVTADQAIAPDGTLTADRWGDNNSGGTGGLTTGVAEGISVTSGVKFTYCMWGKPKGLSYLRLRTVGFDAGADGNSYFDIAGAAAGTLSANHYAAVERYPNGWVRVGISAETTTDTTGNFYGYPAEIDGNSTVDLDGTSDIYGWGAMVVDNWDLETQGFPPYVPTAASTVTHNADDSDNTGAAFDATTGTLFATVKTSSVVADGVIAQLDDDSASDIVKLEIVSGALTATITSAAGDDVSITGSALSPDTEYDIALAWAADDAELYLDGVSAGTDATLDPPTVTLTNLRSGVNESVGSQPGLLVQDVKTYTSRLTAAQIQSEITYSALPLDNINAVLAFSAARKLSNAYGGPAIRVRESGGDTEADIGFSGNALDESALTTHTGANDGRIATGYGQGAANNFTQSTAADQPVIVASGTVNKINGKPAADFNFDGSSDNLQSATGLVDCTNGLCVAAVIKPDAVAANMQVVTCRNSAGTSSRFQFTVDSNGTLRARIIDETDTDYIGRATDSGEITAGNAYVVHFTYDGGTSASGVKLYINGVQSDTTDFNGGTFSGPNGAAGSHNVIVSGQFAGAVTPFDGLIPEVIVVLDSDIGSIPANMMEFYGIS